MFIHIASFEIELPDNAKQLINDMYLHNPNIDYLNMSNDEINLNQFISSYELRVTNEPNKRKNKIVNVGIDFNHINLTHLNDMYDEFVHYSNKNIPKSILSILCYVLFIRIMPLSKHNEIVAKQLFIDNLHIDALIKSMKYNTMIDDMVADLLFKSEHDTCDYYKLVLNECQLIKCINFIINLCEFNMLIDELSKIPNVKPYSLAPFFIRANPMTKKKLMKFVNNINAENLIITSGMLEKLHNYVE